MSDSGAPRTLRDARARYFEESGFGPRGGYDERWVHVRLGPIPLAFPNTEARLRAVRYHDLHHILTGYRTDSLGESEISAWELGAGCGKFLAAWQLNLVALGGGVVRIPRRTWRAFLRGRRSASLYQARYADYDALLEREVTDVRREVRADAPEAPAQGADAAWFGVLAGAGVLAGGVFLAAATCLTPLGLAAAWRAKRAPKRD